MLYEKNIRNNKTDIKKKGKKGKKKKVNAASKYRASHKPG